MAPSSSRRTTALTLLLLAVLAPSVQAQRLPSVPALRGEQRTLFTQARPATFKLERGQGYGTGFFISADGYALTAYHVVERAKTLTAETPLNEKITMQVVGFDAAMDVALLKATAKVNVPFVKLALEAPKAGQNVLGIGNSRGDFLQGRAGSLVRLGADAGRADFPPGTLEMTAPLAPGDSGGPILNTAGEAIGVISYIGRGEDGFRSYAVPITAEAKLLAELRAGIKRDVPAVGVQGLSFSGISLADLPEEAFKEVGLSTPGFIVGSVQAGGPAARAGLRAGKVTPSSDGQSIRIEADVITAINGKAIGGFSEFQELIRQKRVGDKVTLTVQRGAQSLQIALELGPKAEIFAGLEDD